MTVTVPEPRPVPMALAVTLAVVDPSSVCPPVAFAVTDTVLVAAVVPVPVPEAEAVALPPLPLTPTPPVAVAWDVTLPSAVSVLDAVAFPPPGPGVPFDPPLPPVALLVSDRVACPVCVSVKLETALPATPFAPVPDPPPALPPVAD